MSLARRLCLAVWVFAFAVGTTTHVLTLVRVGWQPHPLAPVPLNLFWTALTFIDPLVILLLLTRRNAGLALGLVVIVTDVIVNTAVHHMLYQLQLTPLQMQTAFLGFALGSVAFLWTNDRA